MAKYAISSSGESSMRQLANDIKSFSTSNLEAGRRLRQATLSVEDGLGIYLADILEIIAQTQNSVGQSSESLETLAQKVMQKADDISELVAMGLGGKSSADDNGNTYRVGNDLVPNSSYEINGYSYKTDELGRITSAEGTLRIKNRDGRLAIRDSIEDIGKGDQRGTDDRGHLIGDQFDGSNGLENMVPQDSTINRVDFRNFEDSLSHQVKSGKNVYVNVSPYYEGNSRRPSIIVVNYLINGKNNMRVFPNQ